MADLGPYGNQSAYDLFYGEGQGTNTGVKKGTDIFAQAFQNLTGRAPTGDELANFQVNALNTAGVERMGYGDLSSMANNFIQNQFSPDVQKFSQQQQQDQLGKTQTSIQDLINKQVQSTSTNLTDPKGQTYEQFAGLMNNMGISPSSGAFQSGLGNQLGQTASNAINSALGAVSLPAISGIQGMSNFPLSVGQNFSDMSHINQLQDFGLQAELGQKLAEESQPSGFAKNLGYANSAAGAAGGLGQGMAGASQVTSYVCMELIQRDLLCEMDMDDFHVHIMPAMFKKGRAFWKYAADGKKLVDAVNERGLDWKVFKPLLFDRVMEEPDPCKAIDLYADACHQLCISADPSLWDKRVYRESLSDSLPFLPRLFLYTPFVKALWKCLRIKMLWFYDKPRCEAHYGSR